MADHGQACQQTTRAVYNFMPLTSRVVQCSNNNIIMKHVYSGPHRLHTMLCIGSRCLRGCCYDGLRAPRIAMLPPRIDNVPAFAADGNAIISTQLLRRVMHSPAADRQDQEYIMAIQSSNI